MEERFAVGLIVNNRFGVLDRIAGLYAKRCYNIDAISAGPTENPEYTRLTIVSTGDEYMKDQVVRQLYKLYDVKTVALLEQEHTLFAQHMFVKMHLTGTERGSSKHQVLELINEYGGKVVDFGEDSSPYYIEIVERAGLDAPGHSCPCWAASPSRKAVRSSPVGV